MLRNVVLLPGCEVGSGTLALGGVYGAAQDRPLG
jgi:hypothetical protein